ncbi:MAG: sigma-70 family RNA polymerase sigma factor [Planctomycetes bacterium]|nr:sigma-70 family RNA polymerase sigma factor [Planctomycetota bacterium]
MMTAQRDNILGCLRREGLPGAEGLADGQLLERFLASRDGAAFAALVQRHGPMVLGVCRRILRNEADAEDAFQATFLVLVKKAHTIVPRHLVGNWLYGVACNAARKARTAAARRSDRERRVREMTREETLPADTVEELQKLIDEELERLPDEYRAAIVLCELEGKTHKEAAQWLGWPVGTLSGRLSRARRLLAARLARRGVALPCMGLAGLLSSASVPAALAASTVRAGTLLAAGLPVDGTIPSRVGVLTDSVLKGMLGTRLRSALAVLLTVGLAVAGAGAALQRTLAGEPPPPQKRERAEAEKTDRAPADVRDRTDRHGDPLPPDALARLGTVRWRHGGTVWALAFSPDGKHVASGSADGTARVWDATTGKELHRWDRIIDFIGVGMVRSIAFAPDGKSLVVAPLNDAPFVWALAKEEGTRPLGTAQDRAAWVAFAPDGRTIACVDGDGGLYLADAAGAREVRRLAVRGAKALHCAFAPDGRTLAAVCDDGTLRLWDTGTRREARRLHGGRTFAWSADSKTFACGRSYLIRLWDAATGKELRTLTFAKEDTVPRLVFAPDGKRLVSAHRSGVRLWDVGTGKLEHELKAIRGATALALSPDGRMLATAGHAGRIDLWEFPTGKPLNAPPGDYLDEDLSWIQFSSAGRMAATGGWKEHVRLWEANTGRLLRELPHTGPCVFSPDGRALITGGRTDGKVRVWDLATGKEVRQFATGQPSVFSLVVSPDGNILAEACLGVRLWDLRTSKLRTTIAPTWSSLQATFTRDGKALAVRHFPAENSGEQIPAVGIYETATGKRIRSFSTRGLCGSMALSPDGKLLAATDTGQDGGALIHVWEVATGTEVRRLVGHADPIDSIAFSPDGRTLLWGGQREKKVRVWEVTTGRERRELLGHQGSVRHVAFAPDGAKAASASADGTVLIWDIGAPLRAGAGLPRVLKSDELDLLWDALGSETAAGAFTAMHRLVGSPAQAVGLMRKHLRPVPAVDAGRVAAWLRDLDSDTFKVRERAARELEKLGDGAEPALRAALTGRPTVETRRRVETLLDRLHDPRRRLQAGRALELLEHLGTAEARRLLEELGRGAAGAWLTEECRGALDRLRQRAKADTAQRRQGGRLTP